METYPDQVIGYNHNGWKGDLYWTPSQLYKTIVISDKVYELYLRWRHSNPWEIYVNDKYIVLNKDYLAEEYEELIDYIDNNIEEIINKHREMIYKLKVSINDHINLHVKYLKE